MIQIFTVLSYKVRNHIFLYRNLHLLKYLKALYLGELIYFYEDSLNLEVIGKLCTFFVLFIVYSVLRLLTSLFLQIKTQRRHVYSFLYCYQFHHVSSMCYTQNDFHYEYFLESQFQWYLIILLDKSFFYTLVLHDVILQLLDEKVETRNLIIDMFFLHQ